MNHSFIKEMCEAYYNDNFLYTEGLQKAETVSLFYKEIINTVENLKLEDFDMYVSLNEDYSLSFQQNIIYSLLNTYVSENIDSTFLSIWDTHPIKFEESNSPEEYINEGIGVIAASAITGALALIGLWKPLSRVAWAALKKLNALNRTIAGLVHVGTVSGKVKQTVLVQNLDQCYKKCGIDPRKVSALAGFAMDDRSLTSKRALEQVRCLTKCYLDWSIYQVKFLAEAYINCLKGVGEFDENINNITIFLKQPPRGICRKYYDILVEHRDEFSHVIGYVFRRDRSQKEYWAKTYDDALAEYLTPNKARQMPSNRRR